MNRPKNASHSNGFTLIELLVVIAIIGILVAILIPVVSKMRLSANTAATQNQVMQISQAIQNYYNDFQAYPGATPDNAFGTNNALYPTLTSTEDLVLALMGGTDIDPTTKAFVFNDDLLGKGPVSRNTLNPGQKNAYMDLRPGWLSPVSQMHPKPPVPPNPLKYARDTGEWLAYVTNDSIVPEFIDQYNDARPLLYLRANRRANLTKTVSFSSTYDPAACYNFNSVMTYIKPTRQDPPNAAENARKDDVFSPGPSPADQQRITDYFAQPNIAGTTGVTAKGAGSYILISAGQDRRYGSADDIIFYGGGGQ